VISDHESLLAQRVVLGSFGANTWWLHRILMFFFACGRTNAPQTKAHLRGVAAQVGRA